MSSIEKSVSPFGVEILVVEDSPTQAQRLRHILEQQGYSVATVADGRQALEAARRRTPTLIISDVIMPEMDGYELCRRLKADAALADVPIILVTTLADPQDVIRGLECRADNFILKPYDERYLLNRVQFVIVNREMRKTEQAGMGVEIYFNGQKHFITADRLQILNLLLSTYDAAIQRNKELSLTQDQLQLSNSSLQQLALELEDRVAKRTNELERANQALRESEERGRAILDAALSAVLVIDAPGKIIDWNPRAETMFGWKRQEAFGLELAETIIPPRHREAHRLGLKHFLATGEGPVMNRLIEMSALRRDGSEFPVELSISPLKTGDAVSFCGFITDITERKHAEELLKKQAEELARSNKDLEQFAYVASHDLQEPLRAVAGCLQILQRRYEKQLDANADELIMLAVEGAQRLQVLIEGLLAFSRVGTRGEQLKPVECGHAVGAALKNLTVAIQESNAVITQDALPMAMGDLMQLTLLFQNLIGNAIKFRQKEQPPHIHVGAESNGKYWTLSVRDNGIGIEPQHFGRIFEIFQRLHTRQEYPGTGIGLTICKKIVERHGGHIWIESKPQEGSTFFFTIQKNGDAP